MAQEQDAPNTQAPDAGPPMPAVDIAALVGRRGDSARSLLRRLPYTQVILLANTFLVILLTAGVFRLSEQADRLEPAMARSPDPADQTIPLAGPTSTSAPAPAPAPAPAAAAAAKPSISWKLVEKAFAQRQYARALEEYRQLLQLAQASSDQQLQADFLRLRIADCLWKLSQPKPAREQYQAAEESSSPAVRAMAQYNLAQMDQADRQFLPGRLKAYDAILDVNLLEHPWPLERDCDFLIGRCLTENALALSAGETPSPFKVLPLQVDPFANLDERALDKLLHEGIQMPNAVLAPRINKVPGRTDSLLWSVSACQAPLEELLGAFADQAQLEVEWVNADPQVRRRAVTLNFREVSEQRLCEVACGSAGLLARFTGQKVFVHDPQEQVSLSGQRNLLAYEGISAWRRFFLRWSDDIRVPMGHLAVANLHECLDETIDALREYQLTANRFEHDRAASTSLLRSSHLKLQLKDFSGARADLLELLNRYPHAEPADEVYLNLAQATRAAGLVDEATGLFAKLYHLNLTLDSQIAASLGCGQCEYDRGDTKEAAAWLGRYLALVQETDRPEKAPAFLMLGRCHVRNGDYAAACCALRKALAGKMDAAQTLDTTLQLALAECQRQQFGAAVAALEAIDSSALTPEQDLQCVQATVRVYRAMGLPQKALLLLRGRRDMAADEPTKALLSASMATCHRDLQETQEAYDLLVAALPHLPTGLPSQQASCDLAELCLALGKPAEAVTLCQSVQAAPANAELKTRSSALLLQAMVHKRDFAQAAVAASSAGGQVK